MEVCVEKGQFLLRFFVNPMVYWKERNSFYDGGTGRGYAERKTAYTRTVPEGDMRNEKTAYTRTVPERNF